MNFVDRIGEMIGASKRKARYKERMTTTRQIFDTNTWWKNWFGRQMSAWLNFDRDLRSNGVLREKLAAFSFSFIRRRIFYESVITGK